jgi:hypothetical protein
VQYAHQNSLERARPITDVEADLTSVAKRLLVKTFFESKLNGDEFFQERNLESFPFVYFDPKAAKEINLFRE